MFKTTFRIIIGAGIAMVIAIAVLLSVAPRKQPASIHQTVQNIETYQKKHGTVPDPADLDLLHELEITSYGDVSLIYEKLADDRYLLIRQNGVDGPQWYYDSRTKKWAHGEPAKVRR